MADLWEIVGTPDVPRVAARGIWVDELGAASFCGIKDEEDDDCDAYGERKSFQTVVSAAGH